MTNVYRHHIRFTAEKVASRLRDIRACIYRERLPLDVLIGPGEGSERAEDWKPIRRGEMWGGKNAWNWFKAEMTIPPAWAGRRIGAYFALSHPSWRAKAEALVYVNGELRQGIDGTHHEIVLTEAASGGEQYAIKLRAWCTMFDEDITALYQQVFWAGDLVQIDLPTRHYYHSVDVALGTVRTLDSNRPEYHLILNALDASLQQLDLREPRSEAFYESVPRAQGALDAQLAQAEGLPVRVLGTGHAHIDVLWRWRLENTREKTLHTFGNVLRLMEQYPNFHFTQSQPQLYQYAKEDAPELYEQIKAQVKAGRWEVTGGMWIEVDCNLPSGESLVRQILLGRTFFRDEFGVESPVLWLPDTFGYSWALPQLMKLAGIKYFMTSKISWSQYNRLPYDSFWWQGLDGTKVLTHFLTAPGDGQFGGATYNAMLEPDDVAGAWTQYQQKDQHNEVLTTFGWGDGGGGPTLEMLERAERMRNHPGLPQLEQGSAGGFFERLEADSAKLPTWNGELYLEFHRGTYTTQARSKRANRKAEVLYHRAELVAAIATLVGQSYPRERLNEGWRLILLNQFHDVIPGSSIREVYEDSMQDYERITEIGEAVLNESIEAISRELPLAEGTRGLLLLNTTSSVVKRSVVSVPVELIPEGSVLVSGYTDEPLFMQRGQENVYVMWAYDSTWQLFSLESQKDLENREPPRWGDDVQTTTSQIMNALGVHASPTQIENQKLRIALNELGEITSLFDLEEKRELIPAGTVGNQLQSFQDKPVKWDAWDIDIFYDEKMWLATPKSVTVLENGPLCATVEVRKCILGSKVIQHISLYKDSKRIDFKTTVDWRERHVLLKVAFPVNILSPRATFDIQFGNVERPTHQNTSWDWARFESVGHKWADLSEGNYGVSLLNDCKYGYDVQGNVLRLSLLRAPTFPDPEADQGIQVFTYSLLPHAGSKLEGTIAYAYDLNDSVAAYPVVGHGGHMLQPNLDLFHLHSADTDSAFVIIETIKGAEDDRGIILRLYETLRFSGETKLVCKLPISEAWETNLMEDDERQLEVISRPGPSEIRYEITLHFTPYQIRTIRLIPA